MVVLILIREPYDKLGVAMPYRRPQGRLPIDHLGRQRDRDAKLLRREMARARTQGLARVRCPCRVCNRGVRSWYSIKTVSQHISDYGYHPWQRGSSEVQSCTILYFNVLLYPIKSWLLSPHTIFQNTLILQRRSVQLLTTYPEFCRDLKETSPMGSGMSTLLENTVRQPDEVER